MSTQPYTRLKGVTNIGDSQLSDEIEWNLKAFFDWGLLNVGNFINVSIDQSAIWGGSFDNLRAVRDPAYTNGQVWETARTNLVWETGVAYSGASPISISGVWVNGSFYESDDATYGHHINYPLGRVIFDTAISTSSTVEMNYSYRWANIYLSDAEWWRELQYDSYRVDDAQFAVHTSGSWGILSNHRVQLPAVVIEIVPRRKFEGYELGNWAMWVEQDVLFHIFSQTRQERNKLIDIISMQNDKTIFLYNINDVIENGKFALDANGTYVSGSPMYPDLVESRGNGGFRQRKCLFQNTVVSEIESHNPSLHEGTIRMTMKLAVGGV